MGFARPYVLTIAGFDPSGGAGLLSDIKTLESCKVYGLGVQSALTWQNESEFEEVRWEPAESILKQIHLLAKLYPVKWVKVGLIRDLETFSLIIDHLEKLFPDVKIIWDPILSASAGFEFHKKFNPAIFESILKRIYMITPNIPEVLLLTGTRDALEGAKELSAFTKVYLKGGHDTKSGKDFLYADGKALAFRRKNTPAWPKHGSGCIFSSSLAAFLSRGFKLHPAALKAKAYIHHYLSSSKDLLGYHKR